MPDEPNDVDTNLEPAVDLTEGVSEETRVIRLDDQVQPGEVTSAVSSWQELREVALDSELPNASLEKKLKIITEEKDRLLAPGGMPSSFLPGPETSEEQLLATGRPLGRLYPIQHGNQPNQKYLRLAAQDLAEKIRKELDEGWESGNYVESLFAAMGSYWNETHADPSTVSQMAEDGQFYTKGEELKAADLDTWVAGGAAVGGIGGLVIHPLAGLLGVMAGGAGGLLLGGELDDPGHAARVFQRTWTLTEAPKATLALEEMSADALGFGLEGAAALSKAAGIDIVEEELDRARNSAMKLHELRQESLQARGYDPFDALNTAGASIGKALEDEEIPVLSSMGRAYGEFVEASLETISRVQNGAALTESQREEFFDTERDKLKLRKPSVAFWEVVRQVQAADEEPEWLSDLDTRLAFMVTSLSYDDLPAPIRKKKPDAALFAGLARNIDKQTAMNWASLDPAMRRAISASWGVSDLRDVTAPIDAEQVNIEDVQNGINDVSFTVLQWFKPELLNGVVPSTEEIRRGGRIVFEAIEETGGRGTREMERQVAAMGMTEVDYEDLPEELKRKVPDEAMGEVFVVKSTPGKIMELTGAAPELFLSAPLAMLYHYRYGEGTLNNYSANQYLADVLAAVGTGSAGAQMAGHDIMRMEGMSPGDDYWWLGNAIGLALDFAVPWEGAVGRAGRSMAAPVKWGNATVKGAQKAAKAAPGTKGAAFTRYTLSQASPWLYKKYFGGLQHADAFAAHNNAVGVLAEKSQSTGDLSLPAKGSYDRELMGDALRALGVQDPYGSLDAFDAAQKRDKALATWSLNEYLANGTPQDMALKASPEYKRIVGELKDYVQNGHMEEGHIPYFLSVIEAQAQKFASEPSLPQYQKPSDFLKEVTLVRGGQPGPGARMMADDIDAAAAGAKTADEVAEARRAWEEEGVESPFFKNWSGGAPVIKLGDEIPDGPIVVESYHGTGADFDSFEYTKIGTRTDTGYLGAGFYGSSDPRHASLYAEGGGGSVMPLYIKMETPLHLRSKKVPGTRRDMDRSDHIREVLDLPKDTPALEVSDVLRSKGYDGVTYRYGDALDVEIMVFDPTQIKSKFNIGTFDPDDPRIRFARGRQGQPLGSFEVTTGPMGTTQYLIRLFANGDLRTLFHEDGHLVATLLENKWLNWMHKYYDTDPATGRLTDLGHEQIADAFMEYLQSKQPPSPAVGRLFGNLEIELREIWRLLRQKPGHHLPREVVKFWDAHLKPQELIHEPVAKLTNDVRKRLKWYEVVLESVDFKKREKDERAIKRGKLRSAMQFVTKPEYVQQAVGLKKGQKVVNLYEIMPKLIGYLETEKLRANTNHTNLRRMSERTVVPQSRVKRISTKVRETLMDVTGEKLPQTAKRYRKVKSDDYRNLNSPVLIRDFINETLRKKTIQIIEFDEAQAARLHRLVHQVAAQPMGNIIPDRLLQPGADFRMLAVDDWNRIQTALVDINSGPGARRTRYADEISRSLAYGIIRTLDKAVDKKATKWGLGKTVRLKSLLKEKFKAPVLGEGEMDPVVADLIRSTLKEMEEVPVWILKTFDEYKKTGDPTEVFKAVQGQLIAPVPLTALDGLLSIENLLTSFGPKVKGLADPASSTARADFSDVAPFDLAEMINRLDEIQSYLMLGTRMSEQEARSLDILRTHGLQGIQNLSDEAKVQAGDAIRVIHEGLQMQVKRVRQVGRQMAKHLDGMPDSSIFKHMDADDPIKLYKMFFRGDFEGLIEWINGKRRVTGSPFYDRPTAILEIIVRMRANEVLSQLSRNLAEYGVTHDVRNLTKHRDVSFETSIDRSKFVERVKFYIEQEIGWNDLATERRYDDPSEPSGLSRQRIPGEETRYPDPFPGGKPTEAYPDLSEMYPLHDQDFRFPAHARMGRQDMEARTVATQLLAEWGFKANKSDGWEVKDLPDGTRAILPPQVVKEIDDAIERVSQVGFAYGGAKSVYKPVTRSGRPTNSAGTLLGDDLSTTERMKLNLGGALGLLMDLNPLTSSRIRMGMTTGLGIPNAPFYVGVTFGGVFQTYMTQGLAEATKTALGMPLTAGRLMTPWADMTGAVVARMWREGDYAPSARAIITDDFRILTADGIAEAARREGLKGSFIQAETVTSLADDIRERHFGGVPGAIMKPFKWWQGTLIELATALDNYFRVSIFINEMKKGSSSGEAASISRRAIFDYSDLTEFEKTTCRTLFLFYSFLRKNTDLFWDTLLTNPSRIMGPMRLMRGLQNTYLEDEGANIALQDYLQDRLMMYAKDSIYNTTKYGKVGWFAPPVPIVDALNLPLNLYDAYAFAGTERGQEALGESLTTFAPWIYLPATLAAERDFFFNRGLDDMNEVPKWLVELDLNMTGGVLYNYLDLRPVIVTNSEYQTVPGDTMTFKAKNAKNWYIYRNLLQVPLAGRSISIFTALDRSNVGVVEGMVRLSRDFRARGETEGWLDELDYREIEPRGVLVEATGKIIPLKPGMMQADTISARQELVAGGDPSAFSVGEFMAVLGFKPYAIKTTDQRINELRRDQMREIEAATRELQRDSEF